MAIQLGCVSGAVKVVNVNHELPSDLSKEYQEKFEIKDESERVSFLETSETAQPSRKVAMGDGKLLALSKIKGLGSRKGGKVALSMEAAAPFKYPLRRGGKDPIWISERLNYSIKYLGVSAGEFTLEVLPFKILAKRRVYHIRGTAISSTLFSLFYRLNDVVESFFDYDGNFSHRFHLVLDETKQKRDSLELYDSEKKQTFYWNRWHPKDSDFKESKEFGSMEPFSQDSVSALYYLRTVPLPDGGVVSFPVVSEGKSWEAVCTVVRREKIDSPLGLVSTVVIKPEMKIQGVIQKKGESLLWITDDDRRIPVRLEAKVKVGSISADLRKVELGVPPALRAEASALGAVDPVGRGLDVLPQKKPDLNARK